MDNSASWRTPLAGQPGQPVRFAARDDYGVGATADIHVLHEHQGRSHARRVMQVMTAYAHDQVHVGFVRQG
ncbi:hypothetical protein ACWEPH_03600 [Nocardia beijingensis]